MRIFGITIIKTSRLDAVFNKIAIFAAEKVKQSKPFNMTVTGIITAVLPETSGVSKSGKPWRKKEAIVEYEHGQYPKSIVFQIMNDNIDRLNIQQGLEYDLKLDFETREWNGRHFLQSSCWKATPKSQAAKAAQPGQQGWEAAFPPPQQQHEAPAANDDLPF